MKLLHIFMEAIEEKFFGRHIYHRECCRKEGRCLNCSRYSCEGCNGLIKNEYGYCLECQAKENGNYKNIVALPFKPLFNFYKSNRFERNCNDRIDIFGDEERE